MKSIIKTAFAAFVAAGIVASASAANAQSLTGDLVIFSDMHDPAPRAVMNDMAARFGEMHPDLNVQVTIIDREAYKTQIRNFLTANAPDVANWYAANRMLPYVEAGLFEDVSDIWDDQMSEELASTKGALSVGDAQYGVPYTYYQWGVYYRKDIFEELGLSEPETWEQELANCQTLLDNDIKCYAIGTRFLWTTGGWFDYMNMRTNGYDFHARLTNGEESWLSDEVRATFANWRQLVDMGAFIDDHQNYDWQEALPFMVNGQAASYLMGNFAVAPMREAGLDDDKLDFYQFVEITPGLPRGEDAPTDTFHIPSGATNKEAAREFLKFVVSAENQTLINNGANLGQLPVNAMSSVDDDKFLQQGFDMLSNRAPGGVAQFFDRDAPAEVAGVGMEGFQEFMIFPDNLDDILERLENARLDSQ